MHEVSETIRELLERDTVGYDEARRLLLTAENYELEYILSTEKGALADLATEILEKRNG